MSVLIKGVDMLKDGTYTSNIHVKDGKAILDNPIGLGYFELVEVIRCEHCLHWDDEIEDGVYVGNLYHCCDYNGEHKDPDDFCKYAERREDELQK